MNRIAVAKELVKLAKELTAYDKKGVVLISDLNRGRAYFVDNPVDAKDATDRSAAKEALRSDDVITMGKVVAQPYSLFSPDDKRNLERHGLKAEFEV